MNTDWTRTILLILFGIAVGSWEVRGASFSRIGPRFAEVQDVIGKQRDELVRNRARVLKAQESDVRMMRADNIDVRDSIEALADNIGKCLYENYQEIERLGPKQSLLESYKKLSVERMKLLLKIQETLLFSKNAMIAGGNERSFEELEGIERHIGELNSLAETLSKAQRRLKQKRKRLKRRLKLRDSDGLKESVEEDLKKLKQELERCPVCYDKNLKLGEQLYDRLMR